jgi:hypothetical protein
MCIKPINHIPSPSSPPFTLPLTQVPPYTQRHNMLILQSCLSLLIPKSMVKGVSQCIPAVNVLYFGPFNPMHYSSLPLPSNPSHYSTTFNTYHYILYRHRCNVFQYCWLSLSIFFPSSPKFHYYKHVLHMSLCMIMFAFVHMFIFSIYLPHKRENMRPLSFWTWLTSLDIMYSNCVHLPSTPWCHSSLWLNKTPLYIHTTFSWSIHQL